MQPLGAADHHLDQIAIGGLKRDGKEALTDLQAKQHDQTGRDQAAHRGEQGQGSSHGRCIWTIPLTLAIANGRNAPESVAAKCQWAPNPGWKVTEPVARGPFRTNPMK
ncbi:hypothetical protein GCM10010961_34750 [Pseudodonghicola xiamenensis]|uniref:Uncharacterized protein n=1 Tax=Pseudodonghicola xiamenensis TaxID=337702 RepID=A0A8J3H8K6_9RHOB|nr:hypothetical protein GCM10010961_34750 [Pseudodonghicola xiamenensis]